MLVNESGRPLMLSKLVRLETESESSALVPSCFFIFLMDVVAGSGSLSQGLYEIETPKTVDHIPRFVIF